MHYQIQVRKIYPSINNSKKKNGQIGVFTRYVLNEIRILTLFRYYK
jgi:hypothetical protein